MKYLCIHLQNYCGIYNGMGKEEVYLDLTQSKNKIVIISGANGTGKSTIIKAINLLPDGNENFIPGKPASKYLKLTDGGNIYEITFTHAVDKNGNRCVTKVSLLKNGIEMNPNGNVGSYKDTIFNELDIDGNFLSLSKVSSDNRGLADKTPAERKKIMSSLISSLDTYNEIYKNLNKKSNTFKSYINTTAGKIQSAGDETLLMDTLNQLTTKEQALTNTINASNDKVVEFKTLLSVNDKDGSLQARYDDINGNIRAAEDVTNMSYASLVKFKDNHSEFNFDNVETDIFKGNEQLEHHKAEIQECSSMMNAILLNISSVKSDIDKLDIKMSKLSENVDVELERNLNDYESRMQSIKDGMARLGLKDLDSVSQDEISRAIEIFSNIVSIVDFIYEQSTTEDLLLLFTNVEYRYNELLEIEDNCKSEIIRLESLLNNMNHDMSIVKVLEDRPKTCKDNSCSFVKSALEIANSYGGISKLSEEIDYNSGRLTDMKTRLESIQNDEIPFYKHLISLDEKIHDIITMFNVNRKLLSKFSISKILINDEHNSIYDLICNQEYRFNEFRDLSDYTDLSNSIIEYKSINEILGKLRAKYEIQKNNIQLLEEYQAEKQEKESLMNTYKDDFEKKKNDKEFLENLCEDLSIRISVLTEYNNRYTEWISNKDKLDKLNAESEIIKESFKSSLDLLNSIGELEELIANSTAELNPISEQKKNIEAQLVLVRNFKEEYDLYKEKYDYVSKLKNYSSPTAGSIQSLFMSIYMDKTLVMVNQLLSMLFNAEYQISQYVINEDEFRIPFIGNGMMVDDISSGSTSQVCMMGMIINLVLANMCSTKYNIVSLDEIDGGLDNMNKYLFVDVLEKISDILNIDQIFLISHSIEASLTNMDVILTSKSQDYKDLFSDSNILFEP